MYKLINFILILSLFNLVLTEPVKKCEVCQKVINKVLDGLKEDGKELNPDNIEKKFINYCKSTQISVESRLVRFYYLIFINKILIFFFVVS